MIAVLADHVLQHVDGINDERLRPGDVVDDRDLFPDEQAEPISRIENRGVLRIMRKTNEVKSLVLDELHIAYMKIVGNGVSALEIVLVPIGAAKIGVPTV